MKRSLSCLDNACLMAAFVTLSWSGNHIVGRAVAGHVPPYWLSMMRWLLPTVLLAIFCRDIVRRDGLVIRSYWKPLLFLAFTGGMLFTLLQQVSLQYTSALNVSVLNSLTPVVMVAAPPPIFRDYIVSRQMIGLVVSMTGVLTILCSARISASSSLLAATMN